MTQTHPKEIEKYPSRFRFAFWTLIILTYYLPYIIGKLIEKLNTISKHVHESDSKKISYSAPVVAMLLTLSAIPVLLLVPIFFVIGNVFSWNFTTLIDNGWSKIGGMMESVVGTTTNGVILVVGVWLFIVAIGLLYCWNISKAMDTLGMELVEHYAQDGDKRCQEIVYRWEKDRNSLDHFEVVNILIKCYNNEISGYTKFSNKVKGYT